MTDTDTVGTEPRRGAVSSSSIEPSEVVGLIERLRADDPLHYRGPDYEPIMVSPSAIRLEAADEIERLTAGLEEVVCWFGEAPHTFPDWKSCAEALADMAQNVLDGHPALSTPESRLSTRSEEGEGQ